jgi:hypothetical protein
LEAEILEECLIDQRDQLEQPQVEIAHLHQVDVKSITNGMQKNVSVLLLLVLVDLFHPQERF